MITPQEVRSFWFGDAPAPDAAALGQKMQRWYDAGPEVDRVVAERFRTLVDQGLDGGLVEWERTPIDLVALLLVLDQFPRAVYRGARRQYDGDARAQRLAATAFDAGWDKQLGLEERLFLGMPFTHAEDSALQDRSVAVMEKLVSDVPEHLRPVFAMGIEQSNKYREVVRRFGRFPHRNQVLERESSDEEKEFMRSWEERRRPEGARLS